MTGRSIPPPSRSIPPSRRSLPPPRSGSSLVFLFPPSLGKAKSAARAELLQLALAVTHSAPTDAVIITKRFSDEHAERITEKLFPTGKTMKAPSFLLAALDAEGFLRTEPSEYRPLLRLMR